MHQPKIPAARYGVRKQEQHVPGFPCPSCGSLIAISVQDLLSHRSFRCHAADCRALLRLDARASGTALAALRRLSDGLQRLEAPTDGR